MLEVNKLKESTFYQVKGYPGLEAMGPYITPLIPKSKIYIEVFAGMGRTVEVEKHDRIILNDMSDTSIKALREKFPTVEITQKDYLEVIKEHYMNPDVLLFMDPLWRKNIYQNNIGPVLTALPINYYQNILELMEEAKCNWILCSDRAEQEIRKILSKSKWANKTLEHPTRKLFNKPFAVRMCSNIWTQNISKKEVKLDDECNICKANYKGMTKEQHEERPFHKEFIEDIS